MMEFTLDDKMIIAFAIVIVLSIIILFFIVKSLINKKTVYLQQLLNNQELVIMELQAELTKLHETLTHTIKQNQAHQQENEQVSKHLEHRIKNTQQQLQEKLASLEILLQQQPEDKLYSRAQKFVELGADIDEIMRECDIPRAEAEMLLAIHRQAKK